MELIRWLEMDRLGSCPSQGWGLAGVNVFIIDPRHGGEVNAEAKEGKA